jgi:hypothetical protein
MLQTEHALRRIAEVQEAAEDIGSAYLFRTRLHRMLLSIQKGLAIDIGLTIKAPCILEATPTTSEEDKRIIQLCNSIILESRHLSQRSESLDLRWQKDWANLQTKLDSLRTELQASRLRAGNAE